MLSVAVSFLRTPFGDNFWNYADSFFAVLRKNLHNPITSGVFLGCVAS